MRRRARDNLLVNLGACILFILLAGLTGFWWSIGCSVAVLAFLAAAVDGRSIICAWRAWCARRRK